MKYAINGTKYMALRTAKLCLTDNIWKEAPLTLNAILEAIQTITFPTIPLLL